MFVIASLDPELVEGEEAKQSIHEIASSACWRTRNDVMWDYFPPRPLRGLAVAMIRHEIASSLLPVAPRNDGKKVVAPRNDEKSQSSQ